jgi:hypothetical protein
MFVKARLVTLSLKAIRRISYVATKFPWFVAGHKTDDSHNETCRKTRVEEKAKLYILTDRKGQEMEQNISHEFTILSSFPQPLANHKICALYDCGNVPYDIQHG